MKYPAFDHYNMQFKIQGLASPYHKSSNPKDRFPHHKLSNLKNIKLLHQKQPHCCRLSAATQKTDSCNTMTASCSICAAIWNKDCCYRRACNHKEKIIRAQWKQPWRQIYLYQVQQPKGSLAGSVEKSPVLKRACPFKRAFWKNRQFFCDFARFFVILSTFNVNSPL